jgi:hypothetical protein
MSMAGSPIERTQRQSVVAMLTRKVPGAQIRPPPEPEAAAA